MATHSHLLAWKNSMDKGAWQVIVHGVAESNMTEWPRSTHRHSSEQKREKSPPLHGTYVQKGTICGNEYIICLYVYLPQYSKHLPCARHTWLKIYQETRQIKLPVPSWCSTILAQGFLYHWLSGKEFSCNVAAAGDLGSIPGSGSFLRRRKRQPTPVFLPGEFHGQRSLVGYSP